MNIWLPITMSITMSIGMAACNGAGNTSELPQDDAISNTVAQDGGGQHIPANPQISQVVRTMFQDSRGDIWFGTQNGAFKLSGDSLIHIDGIKSETGQGTTIKDIAEDTAGKIWIGHTDGLSCIDGDKIENYYASDGLRSNDVWCIAADSASNIWIGTIEGVSVFDGQAFSDFDLPEGKVDSSLGVSSAQMVHSIMADTQGTLWFSTNAGLFSYANNALTNESNTLGIQTNFVNEILEVGPGEYWVSTKEDLYHLKDKQLQSITKDKLEVGKGIGSVAADHQGKIWFVSNQHALYTFDGNELSAYEKPADNKGPVVFQIYEDQSDRLWFVGYGGAFRMEGGKFLNITMNGPW